MYCKVKASYSCNLNSTLDQPNNFDGTLLGFYEGISENNQTTKFEFRQDSDSLVIWYSKLLNFVIQIDLHIMGLFVYLTRGRRKKVQKMMGRNKGKSKPL
jgi:hypothetical protein